MRDIVFIIGGGLVIFSLLHYFGHVQKILDLRWGFYLFIGGVAYVIGYAVQDGAGLLRIVTTRDYFKANWFVKFLYKRHTGQDWKDIEPFDSVKVRITIDEKASGRSIGRLERYNSLRQIGTTIGPCGLISTIIFGLHLCKAKCGFEITLRVVAFILSLLLICLGWVKTAQYTQFLYRLFIEIKDKPSEPSSAKKGGDL
jgi:hypothetical protein